MNLKGVVSTCIKYSYEKGGVLSFKSEAKVSSSFIILIRENKCAPIPSEEKYFPLNIQQICPFSFPTGAKFALVEVQTLICSTFSLLW